MAKQSTHTVTHLSNANNCDCQLCTVLPSLGYPSRRRHRQCRAAVPRQPRHEQEVRAGPGSGVRGRLYTGWQQARSGRYYSMSLRRTM